MFRTTFFATLLFVMLSGFTMSGAAFAAEKASDVEIFYDGTPKVSYTAIGRASVDKHKFLGIKRKQEEIDKRLKKQAFDRGGDAVIKITEDFGSVNGVIVKYSKKK